MRDDATGRREEPSGPAVVLDQNVKGRHVVHFAVVAIDAHLPLSVDLDLPQSGQVFDGSHAERIGELENGYEHLGDGTVAHDAAAAFRPQTAMAMRWESRTARRIATAREKSAKVICEASAQSRDTDSAIARMRSSRRVQELIGAPPVCPRS